MTPWPSIANHPACWRTDTVRSVDDVVWPLSGEALTVLKAGVEAMTRDGLSMEDVEGRDDLIAPIRAALKPLDVEMRDGRGFAVVRGFPVDQMPLEDMRRLFWLFGLALGRPVSQSVMGDRLGDIVNTSDVDPGARAYRNNAELLPHSDPGDYLAFLCIRPAMEGGVSRFTSSYAIYEHLRTTAPEHLPALFRGFHFHRFGEQAPGDAPITPYRVPAFSVKDDVLSVRHLRQYVEMAAEEDPNCALSDAEVAALDALEAASNHPDFAFDFTLQPGECVFANNYTALHARTAFQDFPDPERKRLLLRLWIEGKPPRIVVKEMHTYEDGPGIPYQPGRIPSHPGAAKRAIQ